MTSFAHLPILPVLLPLLAGILLLVLRNRALSLQRGISLLATLALIPLAIALLQTPATAPTWSTSSATGKRPMASCWWSTG